MGHLYSLSWPFFNPDAAKKFLISIKKSIALKPVQYEIDNEEPKEIHRSATEDAYNMHLARALLRARNPSGSSDIMKNLLNLARQDVLYSDFWS